MSPRILAALLLSTFPLGAVNPPGGTCSNPDKCGNDLTYPLLESLTWNVSIGLARYPKPTTLTGFSQSAFEPNGNLPTFGEIYGRYFSGSPTQQKQILLELYQPQISAALFHPSCLFLQSEALFTTLKKPAAGGFPEYIHQVLTDDTFTLIELLPAPESGWRLRVWKRDAAALTLSGGFYVTTGFAAKTPLTDVTYRRPTGSTANDTLLYTQKETTGVAGSRIITNEITQTLDTTGQPATVTSKVFSGDGTTGPLLSQENLTYSQRGTKIWDYTITRETLTSSVSASGTIGALTLTEKTNEDYDDFSTTATGGLLGMKRLVSQTQAFGIPGQTPQTTTYTYIQDPTNPITHGRLQSTVNPDGSWTYSEYAISSTAPVSVITQYSGWKDLPLSQRADALKTVTTVSANDSLTEVTLAGAWISKTRTTLSSTVSETITTSEDWDGSTWHITTTAYFLDTAPAPTTGRIKWIENSDGTATTYSYAIVSGKLIITQRSGAGDRNSITAGTEVKTTLNISNIAISASTRDIASNLEITRWDTDPSYNGGFDPAGRPIKRIHNADENDFDISQYACCGLEFSRDRSGATTNYSRDGLKRVYRVVRKSSSTDAPVTIHTTHNGLTTTTTRTDGTTTLFVSESTRSIDGLTTTSKSPDANGDNTPETTTSVTTLSTTTGESTTTTHPDGTTTSSQSFLDGSQKTSTDQLGRTSTYDKNTHTQNGGGIVTRMTAPNGTQWSESYSDPLGRTFKTLLADGAQSTQTFHPFTAAAGSRGQTATATDPDGITVTYAYNAEGEQTTTTMPMPNGQQQVAVTEQDVVTDTFTGVAYRTQSTVNGVLISTSLSSGNGYRSKSINHLANNSISTSTRTVPNDGAWTQTSIAPDGTKSVIIYSNGLMSRQESRGSDNSLIAFAEMTYDTFDRTLTTTDARTGTTTMGAYLENGAVTSVTEPGSRTTAFTYDVMGRQIAVDAPNSLDADGNTLSNITYTSYTATGQVSATWGAQTNATLNLYDNLDRVVELRTYQNLAPNTEPTAATTGSASTTWQYSATRGFLLAKRDATNKGADYTYTAAGRLASRTWGRSSVALPKVTTNTYDAGMLVLTDYSDTTPDITMSYDNFGRPITQSNGVAKSTFAYNPTTLMLDNETVSYDFNADNTPDFTRVIDRSQDNLLRESGWQLKTGTTIENSVEYQYSTTDGRLETVRRGDIPVPQEFDYTYTPNSNLIATVTSPAHTVSNVYETTRNVLASKVNKKIDTTTVSAYFYTVNNLGQRTAVNKDGTAFASTRDITWSYDSLGQVVTADSSITGLDRSYQYDGIGNRLKTAESLTLPASNNYTPNTLNQYTTVNSVNPVHDADGNMTSGPLPANVNANSNLVWDGENRLIEAQVNGGGTVSYIYDAQSRRIAETIGTTSIITVYDGWNPIAEYSTSYALTKTYTWGIDLSGSILGAGGVGGLLAVTDSAGTHYPTFDGNGNVSEYLDSNGNTVAHYEYDPFGKTTVATGSKAGDFAYRFSTKPLDVTTGLYYYGYRFYDPTTGRWPSRDPIGERGGVNINSFANNNAVSYYDYLGAFPRFGEPALRAPEFGGPAAHPDYQKISELERAKENEPCSYCFEEDGRVVDKVSVYIVNRGSPENQQGASAGLPGWTGGHVDLVIPGCGVGMVGFYGDQTGGEGMSAAVFSGIPGTMNIMLDDWTRPANEGGRLQYLAPESGLNVTTPQGIMKVPGHRSFICEIKVCPSQAREMCRRSQEIKTNPGSFKMLGRNCSTMGCDVLNAGGTGPSGIPLIDNPQTLQSTMNNGKNCFYGYTGIGLDKQISVHRATDQSPPAVP